MQFQEPRIKARSSGFCSDTISSCGLCEAWNAVHAPLIFFLAVHFQPPGTKFVSPRGKLAAFAFIMQQRNTVPAGIGNAGNPNQNDGSRPFLLGKTTGEIALDPAL